MLNCFNVYTHNLVLIVVLIYAPTFQRKTDTDNISLSLTNNQTHKYTIYLNKWLEVRYISYCSFCIFIPLSIRWSERVVVVVVIPIGWILSAVIRIQSRRREKKITHWANVRSVQESRSRGWCSARECHLSTCFTIIFIHGEAQIRFILLFFFFLRTKIFSYTPTEAHRRFCIL